MPEKFDALDRLVQLLLLVAAVTAAANGLFMLAKPLDWYVFIPTVVTTGPPNAHFIRDIGLAYAGSGLILLYAALDAGRVKQMISRTPISVVIIFTACVASVFFSK